MTTYSVTITVTLDMEATEPLQIMAPVTDIADAIAGELRRHENTDARGMSVQVHEQPQPMGMVAGFEELGKEMLERLRREKDSDKWREGGGDGDPS